MINTTYSVDGAVLSEIKNIFENDVLGDVSIVCSDGKIKKNKLIVGLAFPHLKYCEVFDTNVEHVIIVPDHHVKDILEVMAKQLGFTPEYAVEVKIKKKRGRPFGSLSKNKNVDDIKSDRLVEVVENSSKYKKTALEQDNHENVLDKVCYDYNPASLNLLRSKVRKEENLGHYRNIKVSETDNALILNTDDKEDTLAMVKIEEGLDVSCKEAIGNKEEGPTDIFQRNYETALNKSRIGCPDCDKSYSKRSHLNRHIFSVHSEGIKESNNGDISEEICEYGFSDKANEDNISKSVEEYDLQVSYLVTKTDDGFACTECPYSSKLKSHAREHAEMHMEGFSLECENCNRTFIRKNGLRKHKRQCLYKIPSSS
jgi:hypothetical protein